MDNDLNSSEPANVTLRCFYTVGHYIFMSIFDITTCIVGLLIVIRYLWVTVSSSPTKVLNISISVFNIVQCSFQLVHLLIINLFGGMLWVVEDIMLCFSISGAPLFMSIICVERYVAVVWPTRYPLLKVYRYREVCCAAAWVATLLLSILTFWSKVFKILRNLVVAKLSLDCAVILVCNIQILRTLKRSSPGRDEMHPVKLKAFRTVRRISAIICCCYIPPTMFLKYMDEWPNSACYMIPTSVGLLVIGGIFYPLLTLHSKGMLWSCLTKGSPETSA